MHDSRKRRTGGTDSDIVHVFPELPREVQKIIWSYARSRLQHARMVRQLQRSITAYERDCRELDGDPPMYGADWLDWLWLGTGWYVLKEMSY